MSPRRAITNNTLFYGDNLDILREHIADESVDLIYLDPPFNSNRSYNVLFKNEAGTESESQITAFEDTWHWNTKRAIVQVKSGKVDSQLIRELIGTVKQEDAVMGIFVTLRPPSSEMKLAAVTAGFYASPGWHQDYPKIQILTIEELLHGAQVKMPPQSELKRSQAVSVPIAAQSGLFDAAPEEAEEE